jgi:hypothetical protein
MRVAVADAEVFVRSQWPAVVAEFEDGNVGVLQRSGVLSVVEVETARTELTLS